jgi:hypothetical protein
MLAISLYPFYNGNAYKHCARRDRIGTSSLPGASLKQPLTYPNKSTQVVSPPFCGTHPTSRFETNYYATYPTFMHTRYKQPIPIALRFTPLQLDGVIRSHRIPSKTRLTFLFVILLSVILVVILVVLASLAVLVFIALARLA